MFIKLTGYTTWVNLNNIDGIELVKDKEHEEFYCLVLLFRGGRHVLEKDKSKAKLERKVQDIISSLGRQ